MGKRQEKAGEDGSIPGTMKINLNPAATYDIL